jgi:hypothetical protein
MSKIDLEKTIQQLFPVSAFPPGTDLATAIRAYTIGFKDGYSRSDSNVTVEVAHIPTAQEKLYATYKERIEDPSSDGEVLRKETR